MRDGLELNVFVGDPVGSVLGVSDGTVERDTEGITDGLTLGDLLGPRETVGGAVPEKLGL